MTATFSGLPASKSHDVQWDGVKIASFTTDSQGRATVIDQGAAESEGQPAGTRHPRRRARYARYEVVPWIGATPERVAPARRSGSI